MKKITLPLIVCMAFNLIALAQQNTLLEKVRKSKGIPMNKLDIPAVLLNGNNLTSSGNAVTVFYDSTYTWSWDTIANLWNIRSKVSNYIYDINNNELSHSNYYWNGITWEEISQTSYTYDGRNNCTAIQIKVWSNLEWVNSYKFTFTYDTYDNITITLIQRWETNTWINDYQYIDTYEGNKLKAELAQRWSNSMWENEFTTTYNYDNNNKVIGHLEQIYSWGSWENHKQVIYSYNGNALINKVYQMWNGVDWVNAYNMEYNYDGNNNEISWLYQKWENALWLDHSQGISTYDNNGIKTSYIFNNTRDAATKKWKYSDSTHYYFHTNSSTIDSYIINNNIEVYPNPFTLNVTITFDVEQRNSMIQLIDPLGKPVRKVADFTGKQLQIEKLGLSAGMYFLQVISEGRLIANKKIIIQ